MYALVLTNIPDAGTRWFDFEYDAIYEGKRTGFQFQTFFVEDVAAYVMCILGNHPKSLVS